MSDAPPSDDVPGDEDVVGAEAVTGDETVTVTVTVTEDEAVTGDETTAEAVAGGVAAVLQAAHERHYDAEVISERAVRVLGRFGEPTLAALDLLIDAAAPVGVYAEGLEGSRSAMCLWTGTDLYAVSLGVGGRWEQFGAPAGGLSAIRDSWRGGSRARYRVPRGALFTPLADAVELADAWGLPAPQTHRPAPPPPDASPTRPGGADSTRVRKSASRPTRPPATPARRPTEDAPRICPTCYMALPATGVCDYCA